MIDSIEKDLRKNISKERMLEMDKYGRIKLYNNISKFLKGDKKTAFSLINHSLAIIDDQIDSNENTKMLDEAIITLKNGFDNKEIIFNKEWKNDIFRLGQILRGLKDEDFPNADLVLEEVIRYWNIEKENLNRRGKIMNSSELDKLNLEIGKSIGVQFLCLLCSDLNKYSMRKIASSYGLAIKLADNLSDLREDLKNGFINISKEDIEEFKIDLSKFSDKVLKMYVKKEIKRVREYYRKSDKLIEEIIKTSPKSKEGLLIFKEIANSWFKQALDI